MSSPEREYVRSHLDDLHADLDAWLRIPSISADPALAPEVARSASASHSALRRVGFPTVEIWPTPGAPAVYAEWPSADPDAPVALVYGHHDVQPVDPLELWVHPPFEPTVVEGPDGPELHARGAIDDKGNVAMHLLGVRAHLAATGRETPAVTVKLLVEGEEESGSPHFADLMRERRDRLDCDVVVVSDTGMAAPHLQRRDLDARARRRRDHAARPGRRPALRLVRRRRPQPAARPGDPAREPARREGAGHPARVLRQGPPAL